MWIQSDRIKMLYPIYAWLVSLLSCVLQCVASHWTGFHPNKRNGTQKEGHIFFIAWTTEDTATAYARCINGSQIFSPKCAWCFFFFCSQVADAIKVNLAHTAVKENIV